MNAALQGALVIPGSGFIVAIGDETTNSLVLASYDLDTGELSARERVQESGQLRYNLQHGALLAVEHSAERRSATISQLDPASFAIHWSTEIEASPSDVYDDGLVILPVPHPEIVAMTFPQQDSAVFHFLDRESGVVRSTSTMDVPWLDGAELVSAGTSLQSSVHGMSDPRTELLARDLENDGRVLWAREVALHDFTGLDDPEYHPESVGLFVIDTIDDPDAEYSLERLDVDTGEPLWSDPAIGAWLQYWEPDNPEPFFTVEGVNSEIVLVVERDRGLTALDAKTGRRLGSHPVEPASLMAIGTDRFYLRERGESSADTLHGYHVRDGLAWSLELRGREPQFAGGHLFLLDPDRGRISRME